MTAPTNSNPEKISASEIRDSFAAIMHELAALRAEIAALRAAPTAAPAATPVGEYRDFQADAILLGYDDAGQPAYKAKGGPFAKFGVRVWPEVLPLIGVDPAALKPGPNPFHKCLRALMGDKGPRKIVGLAAEAQPF